ncbi:formate C-acetyltransferase [Flavobacterium psychrotolerans]|uniref:Formate acetyltransferase n=1 Tax=Flavobacterium psychrotolerans TaxID=2169410 RepID=A0A2U1JL77_9FLAO|nr:formate C-acetyltransferase [Flavobacterium psychrotolerans]PWA05910.1 formate C-acetyltransferase [Flavobacterium psychrotolerans]
MENLVERESLNKGVLNKGVWNNTINVHDFIVQNIKSYEGDASFLVGPSDRTTKLWDVCKKSLLKERENDGCLAIDTEVISNLTSFGPGYIQKENETIVGLQTDELLKRAMKPFGGIQLVQSAVAERGLKVSDRVVDIFNYARNHNQAVFDAYDSEIKTYRSKHVLTGLPDNYARGRIIGDFRRVALYGIDRLIAEKKTDKVNVTGNMDDAKVRLREEIADQINALLDMKKMALTYGIDISKPAVNAHEAVQFTYLGYLSAVKEQDGAAMSLGNVSSFLDVYIQNDLEAGIIDEVLAQEYIDQFVMKLRVVRHLRPSAYDAIFGGDPTWVTEAIGGQLYDGRTKVTKTSFRFLQTLYNLGASPEPNLTILWSEKLPQGFKDFCAQVSIDTSSLQYENDDLMRGNRGSDDYGIACCVSYQQIGKTIQHFGARANLPKALLMSLNGGREEAQGVQVVNNISEMDDEVLDYDTVMKSFKKTLAEVARVYAKSMYIIHYMHDKYYYERAQMALIDSNPNIDIAYGAAGISIIADSLSAIKYAKVTPIRNEYGLTEDFNIEGDFPKFGNDDDRVDSIAQEVTKIFIDELRKHKTYKNSTPTLSLLTITSNVMYGSNTGATPDGRKAGEAFAPGANPMHGRDENGAIASLNSVSKLNYNDAQDGISYTFTMVPKSLGNNLEEQVGNLTTTLDAYFGRNAHHLNVNILNKETLLDAYNHPENYPQLTIRVSGYAVNFVRLSKAHQLEVISRTFHDTM